MKHYILILFSILFVYNYTQILSASEVTAVNFEREVWKTDEYSAAKGVCTLSKDTAPELTNSTRSLHAHVPFNGKGFQWFSSKPAQPLYIPGHLKKVILWAKISDNAHVLSLSFHNGWYAGKQDDKDLKAEFRFDAANTWQKLEFTIPADWKQPIALTGLGTHNWHSKDTASSVDIWVDDISVITDTSVLNEQGKLADWKANPKERDGEKKQQPYTPLFELKATPTVLCGIFVEENAIFDLKIRSWTGAAIKGSLNVQITDHAENIIATQKIPVSMKEMFSHRITVPKKGYGLYHLNMSLDYAGNSEKGSLRFSQLPKTPELSEAERNDSPYGLNVHGGRAVLVTPFTKAGIPWFRDYVFNAGHAKICRGNDGQWNGWPYYKPLVAKYKKHNVRVLGCRGGKMRVITEEQSNGSEIPPLSADWKKEYQELMETFPYIHHWEIDNEYDLHGKNAEREGKVGWKNYGINHQDFAQLVEEVNDGKKMAVENGRAGIWPDRLEQQIDGGYFDKIQVANVHHYSGIEPAEINYGNFNTGFNGRKGRLFFDNLRATKQVAQKDGKLREVWLTEFGWDTKAGHVVTHYEQAAFLPRGFMCFMMAGIDKSFWFFDIDSPNANTFFDGCGLLMHHPNYEPKLALSAMAGLSKRLPSPEAIGQLNVGDGTWGYMFKQGNDYVAAVFSVTDDKGPEYTFQAKELYDFIGNKLTANKVQLALAPVYAVGIQKDDPLYLQTAYSLHSDYLVYSAVGDTVASRLEVHHNRDSKAINGSLRLELPDGWQGSKEQKISVPTALSQQITPFTIDVPLDAAIGEYCIYAAIYENIDNKETLVKKIPVRILVQNPANMEVSAIMYRPGTYDVKVKIRNTSQDPLTAELAVSLPQSWSVDNKNINITKLAPEETKEITLKLDWKTGWAADEKAMVTLTTANGYSVSKSIIPNHYHLHQAKNIKIDGDLSEWPANTAWPEWMMGIDMGDLKCKMHAAWATEGLYLGFIVENSKMIGEEPHSFWNGDVIEILLDTNDNKNHRDFEKGDHQFWIVPQVNKGSAYLGQWKQKEEIAKTRFGIKSFQSVAQKHKDGYLIEALIPAAEIQGFKAALGNKIGLSALFTIKGHDHNRNVYWPIKKQWIVTNWPKTWGTLELVK
ncbi:MAG: hypothetical protein HRU15_07785 [Planctomycetes bacterium]|nr:hypothetical protein [Planctomycetota bacterium]